VRGGREGGPGERRGRRTGVEAVEAWCAPSNNGPSGRIPRIQRCSFSTRKGQITKKIGQNLARRNAKIRENLIWQIHLIATFFFSSSLSRQMAVFVFVFASALNVFSDE
jgi:hypothetical protein